MTLTPEEINELADILESNDGGQELRGRLRQAASELSALQKENAELRNKLTTEQLDGQEVHDYLCSVNPDNQHLSVLEAVIQQRGIENSLRTQNRELREMCKVKDEALRDLLNHGCSIPHPTTGEEIQHQANPAAAEQALALQPEK